MRLPTGWHAAVKFNSSVSHVACCMSSRTPAEAAPVSLEGRSHRFGLSRPAKLEACSFFARSRQRGPYSEHRNAMSIPRGPWLVVRGWTRAASRRSPSLLQRPRSQRTDQRDHRGSVAALA